LPYNETHRAMLEAMPVDKVVRLAISRQKEEEFNFFFELIKKYRPKERSPGESPKFWSMNWGNPMDGEMSPCSGLMRASTVFCSLIRKTVQIQIHFREI
jgi:hypothetical protein